MVNAHSYRGWSLEAVKQIGLLKAPGPDGMHAIFYHKCWSIIGKIIYHIIRAFLQHGHRLKELSLTHIMLIPEKDTFEKVSDYGHISLCNISYKFVSKLLANRLRMVLAKVISPFKVHYSLEISMIVFWLLMRFYQCSIENGKEQVGN